MLKQKLQDEINKQISRELESAYVYLGMAAYCKGANLDGFGHWFELQAREEVGHAMKFYNYLVDQDAPVKFGALAEPKVKYGSIKEVLEATLAHERMITASIQALCRFAAEEQDYTTQGLLAWFLEEQVEEEAAASKILEKVNMVGAQGAALLFLDSEMGKRA
jgi:ferritin